MEDLVKSLNCFLSDLNASPHNDSEIDNPLPK